MRSLHPYALSLSLSLVLALTSALPGCPDEPGAPPRVDATPQAAPEPPDASASPGQEADTQPPSAPPQRADTSGAVTTARDTAELNRPTERERLAEAYVDLYCAQREGETAKLRAIYSRFGFDDPRAWQEAFERASRDHEWLAEVTRRALAACP